MKRGFVKESKRGITSNRGKIKIIGISSSYRSKYSCAGEDPTSLELLKISLKKAEKSGAETELIDLRDLKIQPCKECYSTCPAQCRFNEKINKCDCYPNDSPKIYLENGRVLTLDEAYNKLSKEEFLKMIASKENYDEGDDMHIIYKALREADGVIFSGFTNYYSRPALMQLMFSRLCALDGGVEKLWGDGKNLKNSIAYSKNKNNKYKQRLYGKSVAFINVSKEGDSVSPDLMKACTMLGMRIIPFSTCYNVQWYDDRSHRTDKEKTLSDSYSRHLAEFIGEEIVKEIKNSNRDYGIYSSNV